MTPDEVLALLQVIARQQVIISRLEDALRQAQQPAPPPSNVDSNPHENIQPCAT